MYQGTKELKVLWENPTVEADQKSELKLKTHWG
jgi:hypothetical protein